MHIVVRFQYRAAIALAVLLAVEVEVAAQKPSKDFTAARHQMVEEEIVAAGVTNPRVIESMRTTPRHEFVAAPQRANAYFDMALPIGEQQTISPPFVVAYMTEQLDPQREDKVLEIGTGSGYQAAVLSPLVREVYSIEIVKSLGENAARTLKRLKYTNVFTKVGDGYQGWPEHAPFDKIIVTCSPEKVPQALVDQLRDGGRMIVPVGERYQQTLFMFKKEGDKLISEALLPTLFVPMTGKAEAGRAVLPDSANPTIVNGGFEELLENDSDGVGEGSAAQGTPSAWHYQRQLELVEDKRAPEGNHYARFTNTTPGRASRALQGMAIDGRKVSELEISLWVKAHEVQPGRSREELPLLGIVFYDQNRAQAGHTWVGPWRGTFDWRQEFETVKVPVKAREAIVRIGLHGATGEICLDGIECRKK